MEINTNIARQKLDDFLKRWQLYDVEHMSLEQYSSTMNTDANYRDTFTYWVERETIDLGSIRGANSSKFGIWKRKNPDNKKSQFRHDEFYSWTQYKNNPVAVTSKEAFLQVRRELAAIIKAARTGHFHLIDKPGILKEMFKWKVAYLYSDEGLVAIFSRKILLRIARHMGMIDRNPPTSAIHALMMERKESWETIYTYSIRLFERFKVPNDIGQDDDDNGMYDDPKNDQFLKKKGRNGSRGQRIRRKETLHKATDPYIRRGTGPSMVTLEHNILQGFLEEELKQRFGSENVKKEHNYVDLKVKTSEGWFFYEVKCAGTAAKCIEEALGQILRYLFYSIKNKEIEERVTKIIVAGKNRATHSCENFIRFVQSLMPEIKLEYLYIDMPIDTNDGL